MLLPCLYHGYHPHPRAEEQGSAMPKNEIPYPVLGKTGMKNVTLEAGSALSFLYALI